MKITLFNNTKRKLVKSGQVSESWQNENPDASDFMVDQKGSAAIPTKIKTAVNREISSLGNFHNEVPLGRVFDILKRYSIIPLQEDNTKWSGMLVGGAECRAEETKNQSVIFPLALNVGGKYTMTRNGLSFSWCKMSSGRYEIVSYLS